ncbi:MAG: hypothetical protein HYV15_06045 [Elusimicrobia bacterium]|nr:hypothetical protein [Elusimicrobiota bacterium]
MKRTAALLLASLLASEAGAAPLFWRAGSLGWAFDDITLQAPGGTRRRSQWSQAYDISVEGPLVNRLAGDLRTNASYKDGFNINQAVNTESPGQKTLNWSGRADLFPFGFRRYARFAPNYSWSQTEQAAAASAPSRVIRLDGYGFSGGMSLPRLPAFNVSRQRTTRTDPLSSGQVRERAENSRESVSWSAGPLRLSADRDLNAILDLMGGQPRRETETRRADMELRTGQKKGLGLQFFSLRSNALAQKVQGDTVQEDVTASLSARSLPLRRLGWAHEASYSNDFARNNLTGSNGDSSALGLLSNHDARWGSVTNSLSGGLVHAGGVGRSVGEAIGLSEVLRGGRLSFQQSLNGAWAEGAEKATTLSSGGSLRSTVSPRPGRSASLEYENAGSERVGGGASARTHRASVFGNALLRGNLRGSMRYEHLRQSVLDQGLLTVSDALTASLDGALRPGLEASALASFMRSRTNKSAPVESPSGTLGFIWSPSQALSFNARVSSAGESANVYAGASWAVGRTALTVYLERREISTPQSFSHLNITLKRTF